MKSYSRLFKTATLIAAMSLLRGGDAQASYPDGYYDSLEGKCGYELMSAVKTLVKAKKTTTIPYGTSTWDAFRDTDRRRINGVDYWWDMYSNELVRIESTKPNANVMNIEHTVAKSWWGGSQGNSQHNDIVHLNPSNSDANSRKSNYPIAELASVTWDNGVTFIGRPKSGQGGGASNCYEPADEYKGDFARVFMYMFTVYDDISWKAATDWMYDTSRLTLFKDWAKDLLLRWSSSDPVSVKEEDRNDNVEKHQGNRNPFIDLPSLAEHIWGSKSSVPFSINGDAQPDEPDMPQTEDYYRWLDEENADLDADWTIEEVRLPSASRYIWSWKEINGKHYLNASAFISNVNYASLGYAWSPVVSMAGVKTATLKFDHAAKFQTTCRTLCKVVVKDVESDIIHEENIPVWPAAGNWNFSSSGDVDLSKYSGKDVQIGFKYESTEAGADTWEIRNVELNVTRDSSQPSGVNGYEEDDSFLVEVWGNNILVPAGARIFDLNGREYDGTNLSQGIYIVVKPSFDKAIKVRI